MYFNSLKKLFAVDSNEVNGFKTQRTYFCEDLSVDGIFKEN
jgi:hypothetical protein